MNYESLVHTNALFNAISVVFLSFGYYFIKTGDWRKHRAMMVSALIASALFLVSYVIYKLNAGFAKFGGDGFVRYKKIAKITWPLWMYVGISGVVVYAMAVHLYPYQGG
jgi:putative membrane protein